MKRWLWIPLLFLLAAPAWGQATPTATPTPTGPPMCSITGSIVQADGSPLVNGTITLNSQKIQVVNSVVINPTLVSTNTDANGNIRAVSMPQGLLVQVTVCPPATGQGQSANCSAPYSAFIPFSTTSNFGQLSQGTSLSPPNPVGSPPQLIGYNASNAVQAETIGGDLTLAAAGTTYNATVTKLNGIVPGGTCPANQFTNAISTSGVPTCSAPAGSALPTGPFQTLQSNASNVSVWNNTIGIGIAAPTTAGALFSAASNFNGNTTMLLANTTAGTAAGATMYFNNDKSAPNAANSYGAIQFTSSAYTASGPNELGDALTVLSGGAGGIEVVAAGNPGVKIGNQSYPQVNIGTASGGVGGIYIGDSSGGALTTLPTDAVDIIQNFNGGTDIVVRNNSTGASAQALVSLQNSQSGVTGQIGLTGHGSTFGGAYPPDTFYVQSTGSGGLALLSNAAGTPINFWVGGGNNLGRFVNDTNRIQGLTLAGYDGYIGGGMTAGLMVGGEYFMSDNWAQMSMSGGNYYNTSTGQWLYDGGGGSGVHLFRVGANGLQFWLAGGAAAGNVVTWGAAQEKFNIGGLGPEISTMIDSQAAPWGPAPTVTNGVFSVGSGNTFGYINPTAWPATLNFSRAVPHNIVCVANLLGAAGVMYTAGNTTNSIQFYCNNYGGGPACALGWFSYHCAGI